MSSNETNEGFVYCVFVLYLTLPVRAAVAFFALLKLVKVCVLPLAERCAPTPSEDSAISPPRGASKDGASADALEKVGAGEVTVVSAAVTGVATGHSAENARVSVVVVPGDVKFAEELRLAEDGLLYNKAEFVEFYGGASCLFCFGTPTHEHAHVQRVFETIPAASDESEQ